MAGLTLTHFQDDHPICTVVFGGGRAQTHGQVDNRRIELSFENAYLARACQGVLLANGDDVLETQFELVGVPDESSEAAFETKWQHWLKTGTCPDPRFYVATSSTWLDEASRFPPVGTEIRHYVLTGHDGYIEVLSSGYSWREWLWLSGHRDQYTNRDDVVALGSGVE